MQTVSSCFRDTRKARLPRAQRAQESPGPLPLDCAPRDSASSPETKIKQIPMATGAAFIFHPGLGHPSDGCAPGAQVESRPQLLVSLEAQGAFSSGHRAIESDWMDAGTIWLTFLRAALAPARMRIIEV